MEYPPIRMSRLDARERAFVYGASRISLCQDARGADGRNYLFQERGLDVETVAQFRLGYVPASLDPFAMRAEYRRSVRAFRGRIVFPIFDSYDQLIALSVRPTVDVSEQKYWNEAFAKGEHLYGLNLAKYEMSVWDFAIVVEGQIDVLKMHSHGLRNTVGVLGGAFTPMQAHLLKRWAKVLVFVMDGDKSGDKHAEKAKEVMDSFRKVWDGDKTPNNRSRFPAVFLHLPEGEDPASFLQKNGGLAMRIQIADAMIASGLKTPEKWINS